MTEAIYTPKPEDYEQFVTRKSMSANYLTAKDICKIVLFRRQGLLFAYIGSRLGLGECAVAKKYKEIPERLR